MSDIHDYDDIINLPHHVSKTHPHMSLADRAAQFSPFAALTGYEDAIKEAGRIVDEKIELSEEEKEEINRQLNYLNEHKKDNIQITITYFLKDMKKNGGSYRQITSNLKRLDEIEKTIQLADNTILRIDDIRKIQSPLFDTLDE
jgi:hypothetical protein